MQIAALAVFIGSGTHSPRPQADRQIGAASSYLIAYVMSNKDWRGEWRQNDVNSKLDVHFAILLCRSVSYHGVRVGRYQQSNPNIWRGLHVY